MTEQQVIKAIKEQTFFVSFTHGDRSRRIGSYLNHDESLSAAKKARERYRAKNKAGQLCVYRISAKRGFIGQDIYEVLEVENGKRE